MENGIVTRSLKKQLNLIVLHEQVENGATISNNFSAYQVDHRFETPRRVSKIKQKHRWIKESPTSHRMPQVSLIILHGVQIGETQRCTSSLLQNSKREEH
jgi:hypothetical protein